MDFLLNRNEFKASNASTKVNYGKIYEGKSTLELLEIAGYLNSIAYNYLDGSPPTMDKTIFKVRTRN